MSEGNMKKTILFAALLFIVTSPAFAFRSSSTQSFTDPDFKDYQPKKVLLVVMDASSEFRAEIEKQAGQVLAKAGLEVVAERQLFPPTRVWSPESRKEILTREAVDSSLIIGVGRADKAVIPFATNTFSSATASGYGSTVSATGNSTTYNSYMVSSEADFSAALVSVSDGRVAWYADVSTKASGAFFVGQKGDAKAVAKEVVEALVSDGHIPKKQKK
jgi:hypothetical protein